LCSFASSFALGCLFYPERSKVEVLALLYIAGAGVDARIYQYGLSLSLPTHCQTRDIIFAFAEVSFGSLYKLSGFRSIQKSLELFAVSLSEELLHARLNSRSCFPHHFCPHLRHLPPLIATSQEGRNHRHRGDMTVSLLRKVLMEPCPRCEEQGDEGRFSWHSKMLRLADSRR
jgi:hypothetical protein